MQENNISAEFKQEFLDAMSKIDSINSKIENNETLTFNEIDFLGIHEEISKGLHNLDDIFHTYIFQQIYIRYKDDLNFNKTYHKRNPEKKLSDLLPLSDIQKTNAKEFDANEFQKSFQYLIDKGALIEISQEEILNDKEYLEKIAIDWGKICLLPCHTNENLADIVKEATKTLKLKKIKEYVAGKSKNPLDVFKGLLKSYYVYIAASKIFEKSNENNEPVTYKLNGVNINFSFNSLCHILNRHFAQLVSTDRFINSKTFHSTKINANKIHLVLNEILEKIDDSKFYVSMKITPIAPIFFKYFGRNYALYLVNDSRVQSRLTISTFFEIEKKEILDELVTMHCQSINENLSVFVTK